MGVSGDITEDSRSVLCLVLVLCQSSRKREADLSYPPLPTHFFFHQLGLVGVFPYAAIDMSTFETLKLSYCQHFELEEPETYAVLAFGAISGGVGATSVYPINVLRTKLQASGSTGHPQTYTGFADVTRKTISREGWRGLYKGLTVTLAKVVPAVSISYVVGFPLLSLSSTSRFGERG